MLASRGCPGVNGPAVALSSSRICPQPSLGPPVDLLLVGVCLAERGEISRAHVEPEILRERLQLRRRRP